MSGTSVFYNGFHPNLYQYKKDIHSVPIPNNYEKFSDLQPLLINSENVKVSGTSFNFVSDKKKVLVSLMNGPYHFLQDSLGPAIQMIERFPDAQFIFDSSTLHEFDKTYFSLFFKILGDKKIDYKIVKLNGGETFYINNFYYKGFGVGKSANASEDLYNFFTQDLQKENIVPFRKIYLSRKNQTGRDYSEFITSTSREWRDKPSFDHDQRILNEHKLEEFLEKEFGFEIIIPEDKFTNFNDQIKYFFETKTVASVTSSALTCSSFMKPGSNVVEFINSMVVPINRTEKNMVEEALHLFYITISFVRGHNYFGVSNRTRKAEDIIDKIKNSPSLLKVLGD
jgi:Glycosyltransferase 61